MAGHSQFKNIMHRKGKQDAMRSKMFGKLAREITVAAKLGTPDPAMNPRLRLAITAARAENVPKDNIERAIKKAIGNDGENYDEMRYEGYGPGGVAVIVEALTDNRNRAASDIRSYFTKSGGKIVEDLTLPFPEVEFQALITRIATLKPDAVFSFFAGGGAVKFVKDYAAAGLNKTIPLYGAGFLTDGTIPAQGEAANGIKTTLHYADNLDNPANLAFLKAFKAKTGLDGDIYAVQGYDAAALFDIGLNAVGGDAKAQDKMIAAMGAAKIDSPRGPLSFNKAHNPIQNIYLREVRNGRNELVSIAQAAVDDPARGCKLA